MGIAKTVRDVSPARYFRRRPLKVLRHVSAKRRFARFRVHDPDQIRGDLGVGWAVPRDIDQALGTRRTLILEDIRTAPPSLLGRLPHVDMLFDDDRYTRPRKEPSGSRLRRHPGATVEGNLRQHTETTLRQRVALGWRRRSL